MSSLFDSSSFSNIHFSGRLASPRITQIYACHTVTYRQIGQGCITPLRQGELYYLPYSVFNLEHQPVPLLWSPYLPNILCNVLPGLFHKRSIKPAMCEGRTSALRFCIVLGLTSVERTQFLELLPPFLLHMILICRRARALTRRASPKLGHLSLRLLTPQHLRVQGYNEAILLQRVFSA
jgi:hypothetical protein